MLRPSKEKVKERSSKLKDEGKKIHHFEAWMLISVHIQTPLTLVWPAKVQCHFHNCNKFSFHHLFFTNLCRFEQEVKLELLMTRLSCKKHFKCFRESQETPDIHIKIPNTKPLLWYAVCILCAKDLYALNTWHICQTVQ